MVASNWQEYEIAKQCSRCSQDYYAMISTAAWPGRGKIPEPADDASEFKLDPTPTPLFSNIIGTLIVISPLALLGLWLFSKGLLTW